MRREVHRLAGLRVVRVTEHRADRALIEGNARGETFAVVPLRRPPRGPRTPCQADWDAPEPQPRHVHESQRLWIGEVLLERHPEPHHVPGGLLQRRVFVPS